MSNTFHQLLQSLDLTSLQGALLRVAAVLLCLSVHESCHGLAAYLLGDPTARDRNRLSLNPLRHIDWLGLAMMFVAGFGWAKPVPVNPRYFRNPKWGMALTALAGPASNFVLAAVAVALSKAVYLFTPETVFWNGLFDFLLYSVAILSIGLGLFNLIPFPPLDGSKVAAALLPDRLYIQWMRYERYGIAILLAVTLLGWQGNFISVAVLRIYRFLVLLIYGVS